MKKNTELIKSNSKLSKQEKVALLTNMLTSGSRSKSFTDLFTKTKKKKKDGGGDSRESNSPTPHHWVGLDLKFGAYFLNLNSAQKFSNRTLLCS